MEEEAKIDLETYLARAPDPSKDRLRYEWHLERYRFAVNSAKRAEKIADVGCGWGFGTDFLAKCGKQAYGFEINPKLVDYASRRFQQANIHFWLHNLLDGPLPEAPYNLICMFEVLEHLEQPAVGLANLKSSLARDGVLILSTPNISDEGTSHHPYHVVEFTHGTLKAILYSHFSSVEMFSQGVSNPVYAHECQSKVVRDRWKNLVRAADVLQFRRFLPKWLKDRFSNPIPISSQPTMMNRDLVEIVPGCQVGARWLISICS